MFNLKKENTKKQLIIFSFCLILVLLTGCIKQKQVVIDNQKSEIINKEGNKKNDINETEDKNETDNIKTNTGKNNVEEAKITWKKYTNPLYGFSFEYPDDLKITIDNASEPPFEETQKGCWIIKMESTDYAGASGGKNVISGFYLYMSIIPVKNMTFEEFKDYSEQFGVDEWRENNSRKFSISATPPKPDPDQNIFNLFIGTLYNPNLTIYMGIDGTKENKEKMEMILEHFMKSLN